MINKKKEYLFGFTTDQNEYEEIEFALWVPVPVPKFGSFYFCFPFHFYNLQMNSININDDFIINDIAKKDYYEYVKFDEKLILADLKRIFVFTHDPYLFYVQTMLTPR
jgi:hypothetical protein